MIPISDANTGRRTPIVNWLLIAANVLVFFYELGMSNRQLDSFIATWGVNSTQVLAALSHPFQVPIHTWETLFTSQFIHAGWAHIIGNMLFLWVFGDNIEDVLGSVLYPIFYLASGAIAGVAQAVVQGPSDLPSIGASGAIAGVLGAYIVLYPWNRISVLFPIFILFTTIDIPALLVIGWWFIQQFLYGFAALSETAAGGVAFWAHIGGFIGGAIMILPFIGRRRRRLRPYYSTTPTSSFE